MTAAAIRYQRLDAATVAPLQECIRRVYGDTYPFRWLYDREAMARLLAEERLITAIALDERDRVIGTIGVLLAGPRNRDGDYTADSIAAMVDPDHRGRDVLMRLGEELFEGFAGYAVAGIHLYALALHPVVQRRSTERGGAVVNGILPAYFHRDVRVAGFDARGHHRIGAVALFQPVFDVAPQRTVYPPARYAEVLRGIYDRLPVRRQIAHVADEGRGWSRLPALSQCELDVETFNSEAKLRVRRAGEDLGDRLAALRRQMAERKLQVLYVDLALDDTAIDRAVEAANGAGFCFGALIPERRHTDWLRLQCYDPGEVSLDGMVVASEAGKELLRFVREDAASSTR